MPTKEYYAAHREHYIQKRKEYVEANRDSLREKDRDRTRRKRATDPDYDRRQRLSKNYGMTVEDLIEKRKSQNDRCAICDEKMKIPFVDHNHETGKVRDLLCPHCNSLLGFCREDIDILDRAKQYLERHR